MHRNVIFFLSPRENINFFFVFIYFHLEICEKISICLFFWGGGPDIWEKIIYPIPSPLPTLFTVYLTPSLLLPLTDPLVIRRNINETQNKISEFSPRTFRRDIIWFKTFLGSLRRNSKT